LVIGTNSISTPPPTGQRICGQGRHELEAPEALRDRFAFAAREQRRAEPAAREVGMDEERADLCRVHGRIELGGVAVGALVAAEERAPLAPAAAAGDAPFCFHDEVGAVADELRVDAERAGERALDLRIAVVTTAQAACRGSDQRGEGRQIGRRRAAQRVCGIRADH
jgi:hypothetical protein